MMAIDVSNRATLYEREVWNVEQALGWIGGMIGIFYVLVQSLLQPFIKNSVVYQVLDNSLVA